MQALQQLAADFLSAPDAEPSSPEPRPILASALSRLSDDDLGVVVAALGCSCLLHQLPPAALLDALHPLLHRLAVHLYGSEKLPGLKAAKRAALKAVSWLQHIGSSCAGGAPEGEGATSPLLQRVVLQLLALLLPSRRDPRVAVEAAKALGAVGGPLFAGLSAAAPSMEALLRGEAPPAEDAAATTTKPAKGKKGSKATAAAAAPAAAEGGKPASKADRKAAAAAVEQRVVGTLAKQLAADPAGLSSKLVQLVQDATAAAATSGDGADGAAGIAAIRAQHVLLLASHAAASAVDGAAKAKTASAAASLHRSAVQLSEMLLPYVSLGRGVAASDDGDWSAAFASYVADASLPTPAHCSAAQSDIVSTHAVAVLGVLQANLRALPEATASSSAPSASATRSLGLLASLGCPLGRLHDLPVLIVTRGVAPASRSSLLASLYSVTPSSTPAATTPTATQCLALYTQARLAADAAATGSAKSAVDVGPWLPTLLPALASPEAAIRAAACDTVRTLWELLSSGKASAGQYLPSDAAAAVCSAILRHRALICRDPDAAAFLIRGSLVGKPGAAASAEPAVAPTPSKKARGGKAAAAASEPNAAADAARSGASLQLPDAVAASLRTFLVRALPSCSTDPAGTSTAAALVSCLLPEPAPSAVPAASAAASTSASPAPAAVPSISEELYASAWAYLAAAVLWISEHPTSTSPLQGELLTQLLRIFTPAAASAAIARGAADTLATLATAAELLPPPPSVPCPAAAVAALAAARSAAVTAVTPQLFALLPPTIASAVFTSLLVRYEGDPDEGVRAAARASLDALPLHASFLTPMLNMHSETAAAEPPPPTPAAKKSKKTDGTAAAASTAPAAPAVALPALRDAVVALEFLQWRTGIDGSGLLVSSCQAVLRRLKPVMGSIVGSLGGEAEAGPEADDAAAAAAAAPAEGEGGDAAASEAAMSSLAGYACTLSLQALTMMARDEPEVVVGSGEQQQQAKAKKGSSAAAAAGPPAFDLELAVAMAREAPDSAVRNAALGLMATLAGRAPQAALSHVLQVGLLSD